MTTLIGWISYDPRAPAALHMASDSRITWGASHRRWDAGRKLFACAASPDLFGYSGDVLYASMVLGQIVAAADAGLLFGVDGDPAARHKAQRLPFAAPRYLALTGSYPSRIFRTSRPVNQLHWSGLIWHPASGCAGSCQPSERRRQMFTPAVGALTPALSIAQLRSFTSARLQYRPPRQAAV